MFARLMNLTQRRQAKGFTLVEILVVLAIMGVLAAVTFAGMSQYGQRQQYQQFVGEVQNGFTETRAKTIAAFGNTAHGVYVGSTTIEFFPGTIPVPGSSDNSILTIPAYIDVTPTLTGAATAVTFARLTGVPDVTGTVTLTDTRTLTTTVLTISESGLVQ